MSKSTLKNPIIFSFSGVILKRRMYIFYVHDKNSMPL
jgi:hypothetical protein